MIETKWTLLKWTGSSFTSDGTIPAPHKAFKEELKSNTTVTKLADGGICLERPLVKYTYKPITWVWQFVTKNELKTKLQSYSKNSTQLKIECKDSGEAYDGDFFSDGFAIEGEFLDVTAEWVIGVEGNTQLYQVTALFQPMDIS